MLTQQQLQKFMTTLPPGISADLIAAVGLNANYISRKKGEDLFGRALAADKLYLIIEGSFLRTIITASGEERTIMLHTESFMPFIGTPFVNGENSWVSYTLKANEPSKLFELDALFVAMWCEKDASFRRLVYDDSMRWTAITNQIQNHQIGLTSLKFLEWLLTYYSFLFQRFQSKDIASFMGITPIWLSNLKNQLLKKSPK